MVLYKGKYLVRQVGINKGANKGKGVMIVSVPLNNPYKIKVGDFVEIRPLKLTRSE